MPAPWGSNANTTGVVSTESDTDRTLVTDQTGKKRISRANAIGQLREVWEVTAQDSATEAVMFSGYSGLHGYKTSYNYDPLSNLTTVNQGVQTRTFTYSSLSRLLSATNPESGTIGYQYDPNGNLARKTDARGVQTDYFYDALNRVTNRNHSTPGGPPPNYKATPNVIYTYDDPTIPNSKGNLTKVSSSLSTNEYLAFDILGRVTRSKQTTDSVEYGGGSDPSKWMTYTYNLSGTLIEQQYPSGRVVRSTIDPDGSLALVQSKQNSSDFYRPFASNFSYNAIGAVTAFRLGNGRWENTAYNSRLQPTQIGLGSGVSSQNLLKLEYYYGDWNSGSVDGTRNSGNIVKQVITAPSVGASAGFTATQKYFYDSLNRLDDAAEEVSSTQTWRQDFSYDRYGNRNFVEANTTTLLKNCGTSPNFEVCTGDVPKVNPVPIAVSNKLAGYLYDSSGNTSEDANEWTYVYDAENKQVEVKDDQDNSIGQYWYDGDGKRVKKYVPATGETTKFVYDAAGKQIAEYSSIVQNDTNAKTAYLTADHLGSPRINTDGTGNVIARHDYHPFGEEIATTARVVGLGYTSDTIRKQFTGYERDGESGLDFAQARYFVSTAGRFSTPDPLLSSGRTGNPQTWNRFTYVLGNPLNLTDPSGLFEWSEELGGSTRSDEFEEQLEALRDSRKGKSKKEKKAINAQIDRIKQILSRRTAVLNGLKTARQAANNLSGNQRSAVTNSVDVYGAEHENNGVVIAVGDPTQNGQGLAGIEDGSVIVAIRPDQFSADTLFMTLAHEGSHVLDAQMEIRYNSPPMARRGFPISGSEIRSSVTSRDTEYRAYSVSFWVAKGSNYSKSFGIGGSTFYQPGWREIDTRRLDEALGQIGRGPNDQAGRNPANWDVRGQWR